MSALPKRKPLKRVHLILDCPASMSVRKLADGFLEAGYDATPVLMVLLPCSRKREVLAYRIDKIQNYMVGK